MRITKFGHACVRLETDGHVVVLDPGGFTEPEAVDGATAVLITHEHADHYSPDHLRRTDAPVFTIGAVAAKIREDAPDVAERVTVVEPGQQLDVGVPVTGRRREARRDPPGAAALRQQRLRARGRGAADLPPRRLAHAAAGPTSTCCCSRSARRGSRSASASTSAATSGAPRSLAIHDKIYSELGLGVVDGHLTGCSASAARSSSGSQDGADL